MVPGPANAVRLTATTANGGPNLDRVTVDDAGGGGTVIGVSTAAQPQAALAAGSWVDAEGNGYLIEDDVGTFSSPGTFANGNLNVVHSSNTVSNAVSELTNIPVTP
jgi:hypothetical protein